MSAPSRIYRYGTFCACDACVRIMSHSARVSLAFSGRSIYNCNYACAPSIAYIVQVSTTSCAAQISDLFYNGSYSSARDKIFVTKSQISQERLVQLQPNFTHACTQPSGMCTSNFMQFGENFFLMVASNKMVLLIVNLYISARY